ncbi:glycoside hydrolase family 2 protein [Sunxiuqinia elliptica]|nr:sugar-binding domain-containing protein [Sunxiuqinia elliptica]
MKNRQITSTKHAFILLSVLCLFSCSSPEYPLTSKVENLNANWTMQSSEKLTEADESLISQNNYDDDNWLEAIVPGTVLGSMATTGKIKDPYFGINMQQVDPTQFQKPWWFRTSFELNGDDLEKQVSLRFNGINYRADLWVNGQKVAGKDEFAGTYRMFTFNINDYVQPGKNTLALKMWQHADGEYSIGFVDWNPLPRDRNLGIFREVFLEVNEGVKIRSPFVYAKVDKESLDAADLFIQVELENGSDKDQQGVLRVDYELGVVEQAVTVKEGESRSCRFSPEDFQQLAVQDVKLWWPNGMGDPNLYQLKVDFISGKSMVDQVSSRYGIREIDSYLNDDQNRVFEVNGKFVLPKGGGWVDDLLLQDTKESVEAQLKYVHHMNLNSIRCEGFWGKTEGLYDLCDEYGILVMIGWNCHWEWEEYLLKPTHEKYGGAVSDEDIELMAAMWKDQLLWLRNHPSIYVWMLGSDKLPAPKLEHQYIELFKKYDPSRTYVTSAGGAGTEDNNIVAEVPLVSDISGPTGMKMLGPYAYTPPVYWFTDSLLGGGYGFNTETCPGPSIPPLSSLKRMLPEESLWPIDTTYWEYHTGRNAFKTLDRFRKAMNERYGESQSVEEFAFKSQVSNYELMRPMFEAFIAHKPKSTGLVQWMLNSAWPELYWQLYDTYLQPNGSFYGVRKACNPLHAIYRYGFDDIYLANEQLNAAEEVTVKIRAFDIQSKEIFSDSWTGSIATNTSKQIYQLPEIKSRTDVWFLDLRVYNKDQEEVDNNLYWLSLKEDELDYEAAKKLEWPYYTPPKGYADFTALDQLGKVQLKYDYLYTKEGENGVVKLTLKNPGNTIAFFTYFDLLDPQSEQPILPVYWSDNYCTLLPGEERTYTARYSLSNSNAGKPTLKVKAWNVDEVSL